MAAAATKQTFTWEGKDKSGKVVKGEMSSKSADPVSYTHLTLPTILRV